MRLLGVKPERCHNMNIASTRTGIRSTSVIVYCNVCAHEYTIGPVRIARLVAEPDSMWCCGRNSQLLFKSTAPTKVVPAAAVKPSASGSKMDICHNLFVSNRTNSRADIIKLFIISAQCTPAGASTYYATLKKKLG